MSQDALVTHSSTPELVAETLYHRATELGDTLVQKVHDLVDQGNEHQVLVKDSNGHTLLRLPLSPFVVGAVVFALFSPRKWTVFALIVTLFSRVHLQVERANVSGPRRPKTVK